MSADRRLAPMALPVLPAVSPDDTVEPPGSARLVLQDLPEPQAIETLAGFGATPSEARKLWSAVVKRRRVGDELRAVPQVRRVVVDAVREVLETPRGYWIVKRID